MPGWLRRLKAAVTLGGFWGVASGAIAAACLGVLQMLGAGLAPGVILTTALQYGLVGWLVGSAFAGTLIDFEARGLLGKMRTWRIGLWGALMGGVLAPVIVVMTGGAVAIQGLTLAAVAGLGAAVGSSLSMSTHRVAESVSRDLGAGDGAPKELGTAAHGDVGTRTTSR